MSTATTPRPPNAMTTPEVARYLGLHPETVRQYIRTQGLPAHRLQRSWRFIPAEVDAWLAARGSDRLATRQVSVSGAADDDYRETVRHLVDQAPPLTAAQADRIAAVLRGGR